MGKYKWLMIFLSFNIIIFGTHLLVLFFQPSMGVIETWYDLNPAQLLIPEEVSVRDNSLLFHMIFLANNSFITIFLAMTVAVIRSVWVEGRKKTAKSIGYYIVAITLVKTSLVTVLMLSWNMPPIGLLIIYSTTILPHGIIEIPAICLVLTYVLVELQNLDKVEKIDNMKHEMIKIARQPIFQISLIMISLAAPIEAYLTPHCFDLLMGYLL